MLAGIGAHAMGIRSGGGAGRRRRTRGVLPPLRFGEPVGDMETLRIQLEGPLKRGDRVDKLPLR
jgi:hypothetical protein